MRFKILMVEIPGIVPADVISGKVERYGSGKTLRDAALDAAKGLDLDEQALRDFLAETGEPGLGDWWSRSHVYYVACLVPEDGGPDIARDAPANGGDGSRALAELAAGRFTYADEEEP